MKSAPTHHPADYRFRIVVRQGRGCCCAWVSISAGHQTLGDSSKLLNPKTRHRWQRQRQRQKRDRQRERRKRTRRLVVERRAQIRLPLLPMGENSGVGRPRDLGAPRPPLLPSTAKLAAAKLMHGRVPSSNGVWGMPPKMNESRGHT